MMGVKREREGKWRAVSVPLRGNVNNDMLSIVTGCF